MEIEPLGFNTKSVGATVAGITDREVPKNQGLLPQQILIATRKIGDLAPLTEFLARQLLEEDVSDIEPIRLEILSTMLEPNIKVAELIGRYLPGKGEPFDPERHITCCHDMSGPGLLAIEELAKQSGVDIYLHDIKLHHPIVEKVAVKNPTAGTNGAIIISASRKIAHEILAELENSGYQPWIIGKVLQNTAVPRVLINRNLQRYRFIEGVKEGLFENFEFVKTTEI
jgi:selenophosphate synthase